jgi:eukaryotic-like serine/threonine-protein kinase
MAAEAGQRVGDYEVLAQLGVGGMGRVYKVRNVISNREEAMKILLPDFASDPDLAARFMAEIRTLATLDHPGIAQLRTAFQFQNQFVMVMEFVEGITLEKLAAQIRIPMDHVLDYAGQVLAALSFAHTHGVTHRDIKPANIMITSHGLVKLMDFGIAKSKEDMQLTRPGTTMGSVYYMSPEQVRGETVDARSDLYSFGVTLYEVLTGRRPFQADTSYSVLEAQLNKAPTPLIEVNPAIPPELNSIVLRAMEKRPEDRFQTAEEFRDALRMLRQPATVPVSAPQPVAQAPQPVPSMSTQAVAAPAQDMPAFKPVPPVAMPAPPPGNHRGLWIGIGAALALVALLAVAMVLPRIFATHASQKAAQPAAPPVVITPASDAVASPPAPAAPQPAVAQATPPAEANLPAPQQSSPKPAARTRAAYTPSAHTAAADAGTPHQDSSASSVPATAPGPSEQEIRAARDRYSNLEARSDSASASIQQLRAQQQAQGLGLRGDIVASMSRMQNDLREAQQALNRSDLAAAGEYMDRGDKEVSILEKFLGK